MFLRVPAVVQISSEGRGRETPLGSVGCVDAEQLQELLGLSGHEWLQQDAGDP